MSQIWERTPGRGTGIRAASSLTPYTGSMYPLGLADCDYFWSRYELHGSLAGSLIYRADEPRYLLPIMGPDGTRRGLVSRVGWAGSPIAPRYPAYKKALTYMERALPVQAWYRDEAGSNSKPLVLVEDQLSAIKLYSTRQYSSVALLGVPNDGNIGADRVREISRHPCSEVIVALDADATENAFQFVRKYGMCFKRIRVAILEKDIKDTPKACFKEVLGT